MSLFRSIRTAAILPRSPAPTPVRVARRRDLRPGLELRYELRGGRTQEGGGVGEAGRRDDNGARIELDVQVGDEVLFAKYAGTEFKLDDTDYLILSEKDVLAVVG